MHKANAILNAIVTAVTGLSTTETRVEQTRGYPKAQTPAISVRLEQIQPVNEISNAFLDSHIEVDTIYHVSGSEFDLDDQVLQIDAEVYAAIMADRTLGGTAVDVDPLSLSVESDAAAELPTATGVRRWRCHVRHSITSAES